MSNSSSSSSELFVFGSTTINQAFKSKPPGLKKEVELNKNGDRLLQRMNELRKGNPEDSFCDVTFNVKGKEFHCHKVVLVSASSYFQTMFNGNYRESNSSQSITLKDIEVEAFEEILSAIYTSRFDLNRKNAYFLLQASHMLLFTDIFDAIVRNIIQDPDIDYLIETCLYAKEIKQNDLYSKCTRAIASNLNDMSKTDAFAINMTFDVFKDVLSHDYLIKEDKTSVFQIIKKWCRLMECTEEQVLQLLNSASVKNDCFSKSMMVEYIVNSYPDHGGSSLPATVSTETNKSHRNSGYNVCLSTINVETGAKGWGLWKSRNEFNTLEEICHMNSNAGYRKVKPYGNRYLCYEYDAGLDREFFYYIENNVATKLTLPPTTSKNKYFDIEVLDKSLYLITEHEELWKYDCATSQWTMVPINKTQTVRHVIPSSVIHMEIPLNSGNFVPVQISSQKANDSNRKRPFSVNIDSTPRLISYEGALYIVGLGEWNILRVIPNQPVKGVQQKSIGYLHKAANPAVCCYDKKLVVSGSNHDGNLHNTVSVYDMTAGKWHKSENMNVGRANHSLIYNDRFLYAIENRPMVRNEKYDTKLCKWINLPSLPERLRITEKGKRIEVASGDVFNCFIK